MTAKKILIIIFLFFASTCYTYSNWYGNHSVSAPNPGSTHLNGSSNRGTRCTSDGDNLGLAHPTYGNYAVADNNDSFTVTPESDSGYSIPAGQAMRCLYWDRYNPQDLSINYSAGWHGPSGTTINVQARDRGGSGVNIIQLQESRNGGGYTTVQTWPNIGASNGVNVSRSWSKVPTSSEENDTFNYRTIVTDAAGNTTTFTNPAFIQFDLTPPKITDIQVPSPTPSSNLLAIDSQNFTVSVSDEGGSPIQEIRGYFENYNSQGSYITTPFVSYSSTLSISPSIQDVDGDESPGDGIRQYSYKITYICDAIACIEQGNDSSNLPGLTNYVYDVYASTANISTRSVNNAHRGNLEDTDNIADGTNYDFGITLEDQYGNNIIPVTSIGRSIDISYDVTNSVYLNQLSRSGESAVRISDTTSSAFDEFPITISPQVFANQESTDGNYDFSFKVYAPTYQYSTIHGADPQAQFIINAITFDVTHDVEATWDNTGVSVANANGIDLSFGSLFSTTFQGSIADNNLLEGTIQASDIDVSFNSTQITLSQAQNRKMYLKYNGASNVIDDINLYYGPSNPPSNIVSTGSTLSSLLPSGILSPTLYPVYTRLEQKGGTTIDAITSTFLSSHVTYKLDGLDVILNTDATGRDNYYGASDNATNQAGIKIIGISNTDKAQELITDQFSDDIRIIGKLTKSSFRRDIRKKAFELTRSIPTNNGNQEVDVFTDNSGWNNPGAGASIANDSVLYFGGLGGEYVMVGGSLGNTTVEGKKTIVAIGGDIYITSNMFYNNPQSDILGIIALEDNNGNGGSIYVDPQVTDIAGVLYADKSIITAVDRDGNGRISAAEQFDGNSDAGDVANQLYIYGSLFSENTIGGSRSDPLECPYYINTCTNAATVQKYDLNYMRRYILVDDDADVTTPPIPASNGNMSVGAQGTTYEQYPLVIKYNPLLQTSPPPLFK